MNGEYKDTQALGDCEPVQAVKDLWPHQQKNLNGKKLDPAAPATPCGLIAKSFFNDTFVLKNGGSAVAISEKNIAWNSDKEYKFSNVENAPGGDWKDVQWSDMTDGK